MVLCFVRYVYPRVKAVQVGPTQANVWPWGEWRCELDRVSQHFALSQGDCPPLLRRSGTCGDAGSALPTQRLLGTIQRPL